MFEFFNKKTLLLIKMSFSYLSLQLSFFIVLVFQYFTQKIFLISFLISFLTF